MVASVAPAATDWPGCTSTAVTLPELPKSRLLSWVGVRLPESETL